MSRGPAVTDIPYSKKELAWIKRHCTLPRREAHALFCHTFKRRDLSVENYKALCTRKGWTTGRDGRYKKGHVPFYAGKHRPFNANSAKTQFQKGQLPYNVKYLGHERVSKDGYVEISVKETNPHTGYERRYVLKHLKLWTDKHGPVPTTHCLKCLDGNKQNTDTSNWALIERALLPFLNGLRGPHYDSAAPEAKPAILTLARLKRARFAKMKRRRG